MIDLLLERSFIGMEIFDIGIIGSGPAGYVSAIWASINGLSVILFEKDNFGGTCLNSGCIPTKATIFCSDLFKKLSKADKYGIFAENIRYDYSKIKKRRDDIVIKKNKSLEQLLKSHKVELVTAEAKLNDDNKIEVDGTIYECRNIILATGSKAYLPEFFKNENSNIHTSETLLNLEEIPENIVIIGSGAIGCEWARIFAALKKNVTLAELAPQILPLADIDVSERFERILKKDRIKILKGKSVTKIENNTCFFESGEEIKTDLILVATGRKPNTDAINSKIKLNEKGFIATDNNFKTNIDNIFAIGDVNGISQLAHSASKQGMLLIEHIKNGTQIDFSKCVIPSIIYASPEIAWAGKCEQELEQNSFKTAILPISTVAKSTTDDEIDGFIKVIEQNGKLKGVHIISKEASSLLPVFQYAIEKEIPYNNLLDLTYAHPTFAESIAESLLNLENKAIHLIKMS